MPSIFKGLHLDLIQRDPAREAGESRLRGGHAGALRSRPGKAVSRSQAGSRLAILLALLALSASLWVADGKDVLLSRLGYEGVASLPGPSAALSLDDQARYWAYALYDFDALKRRYQVGGYFAIDGKQARRRLDRLLPHVSPAVLGEISGYASIAYHAMPAPRVRP